MPPSRNRPQRTQEDVDREARARWDSLFVEADAREHAISRISLVAYMDDSDNEFSTLAPKYDYAVTVQGMEGVLKMCDFAPREFEKLWDVVEDHVLSNWNVGRGKKSTNSPKDVLFMTLAALKHCGSWDTMSGMFEMDSSPFQKMVKKFLTMLEPYRYDTFVKVEETRWTMRELMLTRSTFKNFPCARYATDVTFQHSDRPTGNFNEAKKFYSGKHHLYGHKVEVSVLPKGIATNCTAWSPAATSDYNMFLDNAEFHHSAMQKLEGEADLNDEGPVQDRFKNDWAILVDKGYQGLQRGFRTIQPKRKARGVPPLSADENRENDRISHDRSLWGVFSHKWAWDRNTYNMYFRVCLAATKFHVGCNPLRREDGEY
ncbi:hypothetical protein PHMEG_00024360 [Phytophthora megakarya]|uniref:DDE Tnp4 domain-containing protein n=1 Tax=Phytophthora megakarya TaxID=4795 RepID=A0A225VEN3_9STRA|nr:hypothetical protein PHMEG_00024360 [Phytophthora megakarya]